jgi:hypothetical protein
MVVDGLVQDELNFMDSLQTTTPSGRPAPRRITSAVAARNILKDLEEEDTKDAYRRSVIQGMLDGNPPYDTEMLKEQGLANMTNVNFLTMRANLDARAAAAHELFAEVPTFIEMRPKNRNANDLLTDDYGDIIAEEFTQTLRAWAKFLPYMDQIFRESDAYGIGGCLFPDEYDWRFKAFRRSALRVSSTASVAVDENELYSVHDSMPAGRLYDYIERENASELGWNVSAARKLLIDIFVKGGQGRDNKYPGSQWESLQTMRRNSDPGYQSKQFELVRFSHLFVKEVDSGKISHFMLPKATSDKEAFIYERADRFDSMEECLWLLPFNYADGYVKSIRGVASYLAAHEDLSNRFLCRVFDAGFMTSSILLQPQTPTDLSRLQFVRHGPYTILPPELKAVQSSFQPQIAPLIQLRDVSEAVLKNNTGTYRQHPESLSKASAPKTARQVMEEASKEARFEKAAVAHRYDHLDKLYLLVLRRMVALSKYEADAYPGKEEADEFVKRCVARGVPRKLVTGWEDKFFMHATRALGMGSPAVQYDITNQVLGMRTLMDEQGARNAFRDWLRVRVGGLNVDRYAPMKNRNDIPSNEHSIAALENNDMMEGSQVKVGADQMHFIHLMSHMQEVIGPLVQAVQTKQYQNPVEAARRLSVSVEHTAGHLAYLAQDEQRKDLVKQVDTVLKQAAGLIPKLQQEAQKLAQQQQKQQQENAQKVADADQVLASRDMEAKVFEIMQKAKLEELKQDSLNQMRETKTRDQMDIRRREVEENLRLKEEKQNAEIELERQRVSSQQGE